MKSHWVPIHSISPHGIVLCALFTISEPCNPVPQVEDKILGLRRGLEDAEHSSVEGRIAFRLDQTPMPVAAMRHADGYAPTCYGPAQPLTSIRTRLGQTAVFSCLLDRCRNATNPDLDDLLWEHNNCPVHEMFCKELPSPFLYSQTRSSARAYLFIHDVTFTAVGSVYCYCRRKNEPGGLCINQAYQLTPLTMPADVFETPVLNVTYPEGGNVTLVSKLRIRMTEHTLHRYIVRYNRRIIWAQTSHPLHALMETISPHGADFTLNDNNVTMIFPHLAKSFSGQYEVWVRPYMQEDEFVIQTINLKLI